MKPGLYRIRAKFSVIPNDATSSIYSDNCGADRPDKPICYDDWIMSVGARVLITIDGDAKSDLTAYLSAVQTPNPPGTALDTDAFLAAAVNKAMSPYVAIRANVVLSLDDKMPRPFLTHRIRKHMTTIPDCSKAAGVVFGCTNPMAQFPLVDPDLDLGSNPNQGISLFQAYHAPVPDNVSVHDPIQPWNLIASQWSAINPSPRDLFLNRLSNIVAHEVAHGFGLVSGQAYSVHGSSTPAHVNAYEARSYPPFYTEDPLPGDLGHEPIMGHPFPYTSPSGSVSQELLMQAGPFRWNVSLPTEGGSYDPTQLEKYWLCFDRPLRFSKTTDYVNINATDLSLEQFFRERVPICNSGVPACR